MKPGITGRDEEGKIAQMKCRVNWKKFDALLYVVERESKRLDLNDSAILKNNFLRNKKSAASGYHGEEGSSRILCFNIERDDKGKKPMCLAPKKTLLKNFKKTGKEIMCRKSNERRAQMDLLPANQIPLGMQRKISDLAGVETNPLWMGYKKLFATDLSDSHSRLFLPKRVMEVLTEEEKLELTNSNNPRSMDVMVVDPEARVWNELQFKIWPSLMQPVLIKQWIELADLNEFKAWDVLEIWTFRLNTQNNKICFVLNVQRV